MGERVPPTMSNTTFILPGVAITKLLRATGWGPEELAQRMFTPTRKLTPRPTPERVAEWEGRDRLPVPVSLCLRDVAAAERLLWKTGRWVTTRSQRMTGADARRLREELGWTQARLARELDTTQQSVAQWEARSEGTLSGLATYALRSLRAKPGAV